MTSNSGGPDKQSRSAAVGEISIANEILKAVERVSTLCDQAKLVSVNLAIGISKVRGDHADWGRLKSDIGDVTNRIMNTTRELQDLLLAAAPDNPRTTDRKQVENEMNLATAIRIEKELYSAMSRSAEIARDMDRLIAAGMTLKPGEQARSEK